MRTSLTLGLVTFALMVSGCATTPTPPPSTVGPATEERAENIDMDALESALGLSRPQEELGYQDKTFNTCSVGYGFSSSKNCRKMVMAVIHFRLQCRDSEGTISTALGPEDLVAIAGQGVRWRLQRKDGATTTDGEGYGTVRALFPRTPRNDWLRIAVGAQFLNVRAHTISRIVTPRPWCHPD